MINHLVCFHGFNRDGTIATSDPNNISGERQTSGTTIVQSTIPITLANSLPSYVFNSNIFKQLLLRWIIVHNIAFHCITAPEFSALLMYLCAVGGIIFLELLIVLRLMSGNNILACLIYCIRQGLTQIRKYSQIMDSHRF